MSGSIDNDFLFTGEQMDTETGLIYLRARYYDPSIGRFITNDLFPATGTMTQDINRMNKPVNLIDPEGKWAIVDDVWAIGVGSAGGALWASCSFASCPITVW